MEKDKMQKAGTASRAEQLGLVKDKPPGTAEVRKVEGRETADRNGKKPQGAPQSAAPGGPPAKSKESLVLDPKAPARPGRADPVPTAQPGATSAAAKKASGTAPSPNKGPKKAGEDDDDGDDYEDDDFVDEDGDDAADGKEEKAPRLTGTASKGPRARPESAAKRKEEKAVAPSQPPPEKAKAVVQESKPAEAAASKGKEKPSSTSKEPLPPKKDEPVKDSKSKEPVAVQGKEKVDAKAPSPAPRAAQPTGPPADVNIPKPSQETKKDQQKPEQKIADRKASEVKDDKVKANNVAKAPVLDDKGGAKPQQEVKGLADKKQAEKVEVGPEKPADGKDRQVQAPAKEKVADPAPKAGQQQQKDQVKEGTKPDKKEVVKGDEKIKEKEKPKEVEQIAEKKPPAQAVDSQQIQEKPALKEPEDIKQKVEKKEDVEESTQSQSKLVKFADDTKPGAPAVQPQRVADAASNTHSLGEPEQAKRLQQWLVNMRLFKLFNADRRPSPAYDEYKMFTIVFEDMQPAIKVPPIPGHEAEQLAVTVQLNCTLCDPQVGLYGRTCVIRSGGEEVDHKGQPVPVDAKDIAIKKFMYFHSDLNLKDTHAICEVVINVHDKKKSNKLVTNVSVGLLAIKLMDDTGKAAAGLRAQLPVYLATPRIFMQFQDGQKVEDKIQKLSPSTYKMNVSVHEVQAPVNSKQIFQIIQSDCLVSHQDAIPGLKPTNANKASRMPAVFHEKVVEEVQFDRMAEVYAHNIELEHLNEIEKIFQRWLDRQVSGSGYNATIASRKLTVAPSNSCFVNPLASQSFIELRCTEVKSKKQPKRTYKVEIPQDKLPLKISGLPISALSCLVFRIVYKVKYTQRGCAEQSRDFVFGRKAFFPNFDLKYGTGYIHDREVALELSMCPELAIINDYLWDVNESDLQATDLAIKVRMQLSNIDKLPTLEEQRKMREDIIKNEQTKTEKKSLLAKAGADGKRGAPQEIDQLTYERIAELQIELNRVKDDNELLQKRMEEQARLAKMEQEQIKASIVTEEPAKPKQAAASPRASSFKETEEQRSQAPASLKIQSELNSPMRPSLSGDLSPSSQYKNRMLDVLLVHEDTDAVKLGELLEKLLDRNESGSGQYKEVVRRLQHTIKRMLEEDPYSQMAVIGKTGMFKASHFSNLEDEDKQQLQKNEAVQAEVAKNLDLAKVLPPKPKLEYELSDQYKSSTISFKFVAFKTANVWNQSIQMPSRVFFTMKFYMFRQTQTEQVVLRLPKSVAKNMQHQQVLHKREVGASTLLKGRQYFLMRCQEVASLAKDSEKPAGASGTQKLPGSSALDDEYLGLSNSLELAFDFDPSSFLPSFNKVLQEAAAEVQDGAARPKTANLEAATGAKASQMMGDLEQHQHKMFSEYLKDRVLTIDMWNGDSMMHFGTCKIPLYLIMRQGEPSKVVGQEFDVIEPEFTDRVGGLQVVIANHGRIQKRPTAFPSSQLPLGKSLGKETLYGSNQRNKKIVSSNPIEQFELQETLQDKLQGSMAQAAQHASAQFDEEKRKRMRVERLKALTLGREPGGSSLNTLADPDSSDWEKKHQLKKISLMREQHKAQIIAKVSQEAQIMNQRSIEVVSGEPQLFEIEANNPFEKRQNFTIAISDDDYDSGIISTAELTLVDNSKSEWEHWSNVGKCAAASDWNIVDASKKEVRLEGGQRCMLLFKFQSYREPIVDYTQVAEDEAGWSRQGKEDPSNELRPRQIKVDILNSEFFPVQQVVVNVQPRQMIIDQIFRYYEPQGTTSTSHVPNFVEYAGATAGRDVKPLNQCTIMSSNPKIKIEVTAANSLVAIVENGKSLSVQRGYIYVYSDDYKDKLLGACRVDVQAVNQLNIKVKAGEEYDYFLKVFNPVVSEEEGVKQRIVEVFSTDPSLIYPPGGRLRNTFKLAARRQDPQHIPVCLMSRSHGTSKARVNVVDLHSRLVIESFLVMVEAGKPQIDQAYSIQCTKGQQNFYKMKYKNPFDQEQAMFAISTSNAALIQPKTATMQFQPSEEKDICFFLPQQTILKVHEAIVHINRIQEDPDDEEDWEKKPAKGSSLQRPGKKGSAEAKQPAASKECEAYSESILFKIVVQRTNQEAKAPPKKKTEAQKVPAADNGKDKKPAAGKQIVEDPKPKQEKEIAAKQEPKKDAKARVEDKQGKQDSQQKKEPQVEPANPKSQAAGKKKS